MNEAFLLTGGNMGKRLDYLFQAKEQIERRCGPVLVESSVYESAAWGLESQAAFLNQVLKIETTLGSEALLKTILEIEEDLGRKRNLRYGPRTIDIDILFFNDDITARKGLTIPHPQIQNRRFALIPLNEIAADKIHPVLQKTISQLLHECPDLLEVNKFN